MSRPRLLRAGNLLKTMRQRRTLFNMPMLGADYTEGVPGLLSPAGFDMAWTQYQSLMIEKLNMLTAGTENEHKNTKDLAILTARNPNSAPIFNYASMAHNNHFFFQCLSPNPQPMPEALKKDLEKSFGSIETLRREFMVTASSMFGPGFVWLVKTKNSKYSLLNTYLAGSPYPGAHYRKQPVDMNTEDKSITETLARKYREGPVNQAGFHGPTSQNQRIAPGGIDINPILCINMWEHVYLPDYGVGAGGIGGKKVFAESWWHTIDWSHVAANAEVNRTNTLVR